MRQLGAQEARKQNYVLKCIDFGNMQPCSQQEKSKNNAIILDSCLGFWPHHFRPLKQLTLTG
jgi:hypothetical protein